MFKKSLILLTIAALTAFTGCQSRTQQTPNSGAPQSYRAPGPGPGPFPSGTNINTTVPPKEIASIRSSVFSIMSDIDKKDWTKARSRIGTLRTDISRLRSSVARLGTSNSNNINTTGGTTGTANRNNGTTGITMGTGVSGNLSGNNPTNNGTLGMNNGTVTRSGQNGIGLDGTKINGNLNTNNNRTGTTGINTGSTGNTNNLGNIGNTNVNLGATDKSISQMAQHLSTLEKEVGGKRVYQAKASANLILKNLADVSQSYASAKPTELDRLEYLFNQISLDAEKRDWKSAYSNLQTCNGTASRLKTKLNGRNSNEIGSLTKNIANLKKYINAKNAKETAKYAQSCLSNVQAIRKAP